MHLNFRHGVCAALIAAAFAGGSVSARAAASPDFYGIKMNSENHARDLKPDDLSLFPVRRGFDKNVYAYAHIDTNFNRTRTISFDIFNNTDNDLFVEKSFREYYVVLRNGERYRLNEPGMQILGLGGGGDKIDARGSATLKADFGDLNVTKEQIEMVVCSFDMGKVKIVLLPIAVDAPPPISAQEAARRSGQKQEKEPAPVSAKDQVEPRVRGENMVKPANPPRGGRFPAMDLPIFSWLKNASTRPETDMTDTAAKPVSKTSPPAASKTNVSSKSSKPVSPAPLATGSAAEEEKPAPRPGLFASIFSIFNPGERAASSPAQAAKKSSGRSSGAHASASKNLAAVDKEFFWKPRDLAPIKPIDQYAKKTADKKSKEAPLKRIEPIDVRSEEGPREIKEIPANKPFYMRRMLEDNVRVPADEPVTAVSSPNSKTKAPVLKPKTKLRRVSPRTEAKVVQVNRQMGFIIINAGSFDGLKQNSVINVYQSGKVAAKAVIRKLTEDASAALLLKEWAHAEVRVGDPVSFY